MSETPLTFHVGDGSLRHRIDDYLKALEAYGNVQTSMQFTHDKQWSDALGHKEDIVEAEKILHQSLIRAVSSIKSHQLKQAVQQDLMSEKQAQKFSQLKQTQEFEQLQKTQTHSQKSGQIQKP